MTRLKIFALVFSLFATLAMAGDDDVPAIGYVVENPGNITNDDGEENPATPLKVIRDGQEMILHEGDVVFPGDKVVTDEASSLSIAFLDNSAVKLFPSTEIHLDSAPLTTGLSGATVVRGHASVAFKSASELNVGVGTRSARAKTPTLADPVQLDILINPDGTNWKATVGVLKGIAVLTPNAQTGNIDLKGGGVAIMSLRTPADKVNGSAEVQIAAGTYSKDQLTALKGSAVAEFFVKTGKKGDAQIKGTIRNGDGSVTTLQETTISGAVTKSKSTTKLGKVTVAAFSQSGTKISFKGTYEGYAFATSITGTSGKGTVKFAADKSSYKGIATFDPVTGKVHFESTAPAKNGTSVIYEYIPTQVGVSQTVIKFTADGKATSTNTQSNKLTGGSTKTVQTGTVAAGKFTADNTPPVITTTTGSPRPPMPTTPDGHAIDQNDPPVVKSS